ncbi:MAG: FecR domain-containing protein [Beijerinckiaceae bacterium]
MFRFRFAAIAVVFSAASALAATTAGAQDVGNIGAANPRAVGAKPDAMTRDLAIGERVVNKERILTTETGTAQVTFIDRTTLNIGRNSSVTIDKFIYDSRAGAGEFAASMSKGVMRFVGGQISHSSGATVTTPVAAIGVRGGTMTILFLAGGGIIVIDHFGVVDVANSVSRQTILRPGYAVQVNGRNEVIGEAFPVPPQLLAEANARLTSRIGQMGGAHALPSDRLAARYGIGHGRLAEDPRTAPGLDTVGLVNTGDLFIANKSQQQVMNSLPLRITTITAGGTQTITVGGTQTSKVGATQTSTEAATQTSTVGTTQTTTVTGAAATFTVVAGTVLVLGTSVPIFRFLNEIVATTPAVQIQ